MAEFFLSLLAGVGFALIAGLCIQSMLSREKMIIETIYKAEHDITVAQIDRERNLELREMFDVSEPEWHLLNEMAGEPDYCTQNKLPTRKIDHG